MTGEEARRLATEGSWVQRKAWVRPDHYELVARINALQDDGLLKEVSDWVDVTSLTRAVLCAVDYADGVILYGYAELYPVREEDWLADDWEEFDYAQFEA
jgi:hypothetical protein